MGFGNGGFARRAEIELSNLATRGVESSNQNGSDTDILVFNMGSSVNVGVDEDINITDPPTPVIVGDEQSAGSHEVNTSVVVDTV